MLVLLANDVQVNPGPVYSSYASHSLGINFLYLNARSLKAFVQRDDNSDSYKVSKITLLQQLVHGGTYDVVCICETWLNGSVLSSELLPGYSIFRRDRLGKVGSGVLVAVNTGITAYKPLVDWISRLTVLNLL